MRVQNLIGVTCFAALLLPLVVLRAQEAKEKSDAPKGKPEAKPVSIPKEEIYTTSAEAGFKKRLQALFHSKDDSPVFPYSKNLKAINEKMQGASNIFMVRGKDISEAVMCTRFVFTETDSADKPADRDFDQKKIKSDKTWVVLYLGTGWSTPPRWDFNTASLHNMTVEIRCRQEDPLISTNDNIQYFYWVPLPPLKKGRYELKLIDSDKGRPALIRYVDVP